MAFLVLVLVSSLLLEVVLVEMKIPVEELIKKCKDLKKQIICDPNGILNGSVKDIKKEIGFTSSNSSCRSLQEHCVKKRASCNMYIVIEDGMQSNYTHNHLLEEAKRYATRLMEKLVSSKCGNSFLLFYCYQDHVFYVVTEEGVKNKLQSKTIGEIAVMNKKKLSSNLTDGLLGLIKDFRLVFSNKYVSELRFNFYSSRYQEALMGGAKRSTHLLWPYLITIVTVLRRKSWGISHFPTTS